jgi:hypothetical protein
MLRAIAIVMLVTCAFVAEKATAGTITIPSLYQGDINSDGVRGNTGDPANMYTGFNADDGTSYHSYAMFRIPAGTYAAATLNFTPSTWGNINSALIGFYDVKLPFFVLQSSAGFIDTGSGSQYASQVLGSTPVSVTLGGTAVADINSVAGGTYPGGTFVVGFTNLSAFVANTAIFINGNHEHTPILELTSGPVSATPLPAALPLFATGLGLMGLLGWRRKRKGAVAIAA